MYSKPSEDTSSSGGYNNLILMMRCSMKHQFMEQEERTEKAKDQEECAEDCKQQERADMLFCQEHQHLLTKVMIMMMMLMVGGADHFAARGHVDLDIINVQGNSQNSGGTRST